MSTSVLPILKSAYPEIKIGFVVGSWARMVVDDNPLVDFVHIVDHWWLDRSKKSLFQKLREYVTTRSTAFRAIKAQEYEVGIDLYTCFPSMASLLWQANIPVRIGYVSSGFGPMLSNGIRFPDFLKHETLYHSDLLRQLPIPEEHFKKQHSVLPVPDDQDEQEVCSLLGTASLKDVRYCVVHMASGMSVKEWALDSWRSLSEKLLEEGFWLLFTGVGMRENVGIESVISNLPRCINGCDKLGWKSYLAAVKHAHLMFCVDSMAGHVARTLGTRYVVISHGITSAVRWRPSSTHGLIVENPVPCAPCQRKNGCASMTCLRGIDVEQVYRAAKALTARLSP
jgi:heptosyltransferase-2